VLAAGFYLKRKTHDSRPVGRGAAKLGPKQDCPMYGETITMRVNPAAVSLVTAVKHAESTASSA